MADRSDIDEVRQRTDLVSVVEKYVTLKRSGRGMAGLCPFHQEKTPSFHVNPELGLWKCFGQCNEGGDVFKFVQKIENLSFPEALERLALQAGVTLAPRGRASGGGDAPESRSGGEGGGYGERERLYKVNALALRFFRETLARSAAAREYLAGRGVAHAAAEAFSLGFAPDTWDALTSYLARQGVAAEDAERAGLIGKNDRGGYYDRLRGRLVFPIFDVQDRPIAFGGRLLGEAGPGAPKYWNSPETPVFSKSRTLYGLGPARKTIAAEGRAVVVEGYTDVVAAHQAGFPNVVATLGTSLTEEHVKVLARLAPTVLLAFDADSAGLKAAFRAAAIFEAQEVEVRVLDMPEGEDPDSLLRAGRRIEFQSAIDKAQLLIDYRLGRLTRVIPRSEEERVNIFRKALPIVAAVPNETERAKYTNLLARFHPYYDAERTGAAQEQIARDVLAYQDVNGSPNWFLPYETKANKAPSLVPRKSAAEQAERHLLQALAGDAALAETVLTGIGPEEFWTDTGRALAARLFDAHLADFEPDARRVLAELEAQDAALASALTDILMEEGGAPLTPETVLADIAHLKLRAKRTLLRQFKEQIAQGQADPALLSQYQHLQKELKGMPLAA